MSSFLRKTFGGLSLSYYLRQLFFGGLIVALFFLVQATGHIGVMTAIIVGLSIHMRNLSMALCLGIMCFL